MGARAGRAAVVTLGGWVVGVGAALASPATVTLPTTNLPLPLDEARWQVRTDEGRDVIVFRGLMDQQLELRAVAGSCATALPTWVGELERGHLEVATAGWLPPTFHPEVVTHLSGLTLCHDHAGAALRVDVIITPEAVTMGGGDPAALQQYEDLYPGVLQAIAAAITTPPSMPAPTTPAPVDAPPSAPPSPRPRASGAKITAPDLRAGFAMFDPGAARRGSTHVGFALDAGYRWARPTHAFAVNASAAALSDGQHMWRIDARAGVRRRLAIFDLGVELGAGADAIDGDFTYVAAAPYGTVALRLGLSAFTYEFAYVRRAADDGDIDRERRHVFELAYPVGRRRLVFGASFGSIGTTSTDGGDLLGIYFGYAK